MTHSFPDQPWLAAAMVITLTTADPRKKVSRVRTKAIVLVLLLAIYSCAGVSASQAQFATMQSPGEGTGWKGLVPLRSTRRDVEALLGPPTTPGQSSYETNEATVFVEYTYARCEKGFRYGYNVAKDTVVSIIVSPKEPVMFTDLKIDKSKYPLQSGISYVDQRIYYANQGEGITIIVDEITGKVRCFIYLPTEDSQQKLRCRDAVTEVPIRLH